MFTLNIMALLLICSKMHKNTFFANPFSAFNNKNNRDVFPVINIKVLIIERYTYLVVCDIEHFIMIYHYTFFFILQ